MSDWRSCLAALPTRLDRAPAVLPCAKPSEFRSALRPDSVGRDMCVLGLCSEWIVGTSKKEGR